MAVLGLRSPAKSCYLAGEGLDQAFQFIDSGAAELGFVALSQVINVQGLSVTTLPASIELDGSADAGGDTATFIYE